MASTKPCSLLFLVLCIIMVMTTQVAMGAGRGIPTSHKEVDKKQPEFFYDSHDGTILIPGVGRVMILPGGTVSGSGGDDSYNGSGGGTGMGSGYTPGRDDSYSGSGGGTGMGSGYIPGGDDTFVPNPGVEVPNPVGGVTQP